MKKKNKANEKESGDSNSDNFSFESEAEKAVDEMFKKSSNVEQKPVMPHISEKIKVGMEIKHNLPDKGYLEVKAETGKVKFIDRYGEPQVKEKVIVTSRDIHNIEYVEITDGLFSMDFRNDCNFWFNRSPVTVPSMINQAVRTHLDTKKCYEMEKRKLDIPLWLILGLVVGCAIILVMLFSLMS